MIVMRLKLNRIYGFEDFEINFSYPKKIVNSIIENETLADRPRFRYKKAVVLMGANATGKTCLGKALLRIFTYLDSGNQDELFEMVSGDTGSFTIDFVNEGFVLHRLSAVIKKAESNVDIKYWNTKTGKMDSYEKCIENLLERTEEAAKSSENLKEQVGPLRYRFAWPESWKPLMTAGLNQQTLLKTLRAVIGTLDPTLDVVTQSEEQKDIFIVRSGTEDIVIQEGKLLNRKMISRGTAEGITVAILMATMIENAGQFYYGDELFTSIQSDVEKRIFGLMMDRLGDNHQMIFTTNNMDMLDLNLPKHSFIFLRKKLVDGIYQVSAISASEVLERNTDSVHCAVENDVFGSLPDTSLLDELEL